MTFHKYVKIRPVGYEDTQHIFSNPDDEIIIQEKMDGANFRFMIDEDGNVTFGSRTQELTADREHKYEKNFRRCIEHVAEKVRGGIGFEGLIFYGECMVKHTLSYDWETVPPFLGFDIYDCKKEEFLPYERARNIYEGLGLEMVPLVKTCNASEIGEINEESVPQSHYSLHKAEGLVYKNYRLGVFAKYVRDDFKEKNAEVFGGRPKIGDGNNSEFCYRYATNPRIDKQIFSLMNEGHKLELPLMKHLPNKVWDDIWEEEWQEIKMLRGPIDFNQCRKLVTKRCLAVLQQMITNQAIVGEQNGE